MISGGAMNALGVGFNNPTARTRLVVSIPIQILCLVSRDRVGLASLLLNLLDAGA